MKKSGIIYLIMCLILLVQLCSAPVWAAEETPDNAVLFGSHSLDALQPVLGNNRLVRNASSMLLYEVKSDTLMYAWNADEETAPASFAKILTALIAIEQGDPDEVITVKQEVIDTVPYDAVSADLKDQEQLTLRDLIYLMMVGSANDAAAVIAHHISGSQVDFALEMNKYAYNLGCTHTHFTNAHGLSDTDQYTTARDTARILAAAIGNAEFCTVFGTTRYTVEETNQSKARNLITGNHLMSKARMEIYYDARVTGGRTGVNSENLNCLATTAEQNGMQIICIVMGCQSEYGADGYTVKKYGSFSETSQLLDQCFNGYSSRQILFAGQVLRQHPVSGATNSLFLGTDRAFSAVLPDTVTDASLEYRYTDMNMQFQAPIEKGTALANVEIWYGGTCVAHSDLVAMNEVRTPQEDSYTEPPAQEKKPLWPTVLVGLGIAAALLLTVVIVIRTKRSVRSAAARRRSRNYRRSRRRSR